MTAARFLSAKASITLGQRIDVLALPNPVNAGPFFIAMWRCMRGDALLARGNRQDAGVEFEEALRVQSAATAASPESLYEAFRLSESLHRMERVCAGDPVRARTYRERRKTLWQDWLEHRPRSRFVEEQALASVAP